MYDWDLARVSTNQDKRTVSTVMVSAEGPDVGIQIPLTSSALVVLFHPTITRTKRYEPLNFLLAYGVKDPLPGLFEELGDKCGRKSGDARGTFSPGLLL